MISFKWRHFEKTIILMAVRWYVAYPLSYRNVMELLAERGVDVNHSTIYRWVIKYTTQLENKFRKSYKLPVGSSWRIDETYVKISGNWYYLYRAVDKHGNTIDFLLCKKRDKKAAKRFFKKSISTNGYPQKATIDKSGANKSALDAINNDILTDFPKTRFLHKIIIRQIKYLNNIVEQDHRFIKKVIKPMLGFKKFHSAKATLAGIELHHMLKKSQHVNVTNMTIFEQFYSLADNCV